MTRSVRQNLDLQRLERLRNALLDWDVTVDDARMDLAVATARLQNAVRERALAAAELSALLGAAA